MADIYTATNDFEPGVQLTTTGGVWEGTFSLLLEFVARDMLADGPFTARITAVVDESTDTTAVSVVTVLDFDSEGFHTDSHVFSHHNIRGFEF